MRRTLSFVLFWAALFASPSVEAQIIPLQPDSLAENSCLQPGPEPQSDAFPVGPKRQKLSPVTKGAAVLLAGAGIWTATFALADEPVQQYTQSHRSTTADVISLVMQPLGRHRYMMPAAGASFAGGVLLKDAKLQKAGLLSMGSILVSSGITSVLKNQFHRYRPNITTENHVFDGPIPTSDNTSLPSSHTATAFAVATSFATVYGYEYKFVPPVAYGIATLVGLSRINDNAHWATDVIAGAVVGYVSARGTLYLYDMVNQQLKTRKQRLFISPQLGTQSGGLSATMVF